MITNTGSLLPENYRAKFSALFNFFLRLNIYHKVDVIHQTTGEILTQASEHSTSSIGLIEAGKGYAQNVYAAMHTCQLMTAFSGCKFSNNFSPQLQLSRQISSFVFDV